MIGTYSEYGVCQKLVARPVFGMKVGMGSAEAQVQAVAIVGILDVEGLMLG